MLTPYSSLENWADYSELVKEFLPTLQAVITEFNSIKRIRFPAKEIEADVLYSHAKKRIEDGIMPHYITCFSVSDILMELLHKRWIQSGLILIFTKWGKIHVALEIPLWNEKYIIGWSNDIIVFATEHRYTTLFEQEANDIIAWEITPIDRETLQAQFDNPVHQEFLRARVQQVVSLSLSPRTDHLMTQQLTLHVDLPGNGDFLHENGMLGWLMPSPNQKLRGIQGSLNSHRPYDIMATMAQTLEWTLGWRPSRPLEEHLPQARSGHNHEFAKSFFM